MKYSSKRCFEEQMCHMTLDDGIFEKNVTKSQKKKELDLAPEDAVLRIIFQPREFADLVAFTKEILNGKLNFLCCAWYERFCKLER